MSVSIIERPPTATELAALQSLRLRLPNAARYWREGAEHMLVLWAFWMLLVTLAWWGLSWGGAKLLGTPMGLHAPATFYVLGIALVLTGIFAAISTANWMRKWRARVIQLRSEAESAVVHEEHYRFDAAKRFQELEHGGLIYFLRTTSEDVLTIYDEESQDLGAGDGDPMKSTFKPRTELVIVRTPGKGHVLGIHFSGEVLEAGAPVELILPPKEWPEGETLCDIPWDQLEVRLGPGHA